MKLEEALSKRITTLILEYCSELNAPLHLKRLAKAHNVLPIYVDWTAFFGLRPDGEILLVPTEEEEDPVVELDERYGRLSLFRGARKYAELVVLIPKRPDDARDCPGCEGTGRIPLPGLDPDTIICYCGGLGWLTEEEIRSIP